MVCRFFCVALVKDEMDTKIDNVSNNQSKSTSNRKHKVNPIRLDRTINVKIKTTVQAKCQAE